MKYALTLAASVAALFASAAALSARSGAVTTYCKDDIARLCAGLPQGDSVRDCLEINFDKVSEACKRALDTTGDRHRGTRNR